MNLNSRDEEFGAGLKDLSVQVEPPKMSLRHVLNNNGEDALPKPECIPPPSRGCSFRQVSPNLH